MHPIWFVRWCWERLWDSRELIPAFEANQGTLSLLALGLALAAFIWETRSANKAKAEATQAERDRRAYEAGERERAEAARRTGDEDRQLMHMATFVSTANAVIREVENEIHAELGHRTAHPDQNILSPGPSVKRAAAVAAGSLSAILPSAPMVPHLIVTIRSVALELEELAVALPQLGDAGRDALTSIAQHLVNRREAIGEFNIELISTLRPALAEAGIARPTATHSL